MMRHESVRVGLLVFALTMLFSAVGGLHADERSTHAPAVRPLELYEQWSGFNSGFPGQPTFQFIRDYETWKSFWAKHQPDEFMPQIDLDKLMVFVWCPGPVLSGERLVEVLRFYRDAGGLTLVVRTEIRRDSGAWRSPYLLAFLQKAAGDVRIVRPGSRARREAALMPLYDWKDMGLPSIYHPASASLQAPKRPYQAWRNPWELEIPNPRARPAWTKPAATTQAVIAPTVTTPPSTGAGGTASPPAKPGQSASAGTGASAGGKPGDGLPGGGAPNLQDPSEVGNASGADPLQDPFNLDF